MLPLASSDFLSKHHYLHITPAKSLLYNIPRSKEQNSSVSHAEVRNIFGGLSAAANLIFRASNIIHGSENVRHKVLSL